MAAIELRAPAARVLHLDVGNVQAGPKREGKPGRDVERLRRVEAVVAVACSEVDRPKEYGVLGRNSGVRDIVDNRAGPGEVGIGTDKEIRVDVSQPAVRAERDGTVVKAGAHDEVVVVV